MKKIYRYFFAAVAIASAASCAEQMENDQVPGGQAGPADFAQMTISASLGEVTKTTYDNQNVLWEGTESITVFSKGSESSPAKFDMGWCSQDKTKASFTGLADLNAETYYAAYPHSASNACTAEGVLTVNIPAEQTAVAGGFASGANVAVAAFAKDDANVVFNNVSSLLSFGFETDADAILTKSVTVKVKKNATEYYGIAGNVSVNYEADGDLVVSEGSVQSIVLNAPEGGFAKGKTYYVAVAPVGAVAELELLYTHTDGTTPCERKNSNIVASLTRSTLVPLETIPVAYDDLPQEDFEVTIDFSTWPFKEAELTEPYIPNSFTAPCTCPSASHAKAFSEPVEYTFEYGYNGQKFPLSTALSVGKHMTGYKYENGALCFYNKEKTDDETGIASYGGFIKCPVVQGRYLKKFTVYHNDDKAVMYRMHYWFPCPYKTTNYTAQKGTNSITWGFPYGNTPMMAEINGEYSFGPRTYNVHITKIVFEYSKNQPLSPVYK